MAALHLAPELATLVDEPPAGPGWFHEPKLDGYRLLAQLSTKRSTREVTLWTRRAQDWTSRAPVVAEALKAISARDFVLDGELVVLARTGSATSRPYRTCCVSSIRRPWSTLRSTCSG